MVYFTRTPREGRREDRGGGLLGRRGGGGEEEEEEREEEEGEEGGTPAPGCEVFLSLVESSIFYFILFFKRPFHFKSLISNRGN